MALQLFQAKGYYLEEIVKELMRKSNFVNVETGTIEGRGADHQIDSYGRLSFTLPFVYPIRLISEVKWFTPMYRVKLFHMRSFLGVIIDISQNYFASRQNTSLAAFQQSSSKERYTDCGVFFSATGFTKDAQDYAWAHGIYLVSFSQDKVLEPLLTKSQRSLVQNPAVWRGSKSTKSNVVAFARRNLQSSSLDPSVQEVFAYVGILDGLYPVMIVSSGKFDFNPTASDDLTEGDVTSENNIAFKERRVEEEDDINFQFRFRGIRFGFSLPMKTAAKIVKAINSTYGGETFATLDIPIVLKTDERIYRRIYRIRLNLQYRTEMMETLKQTLH